MDGHLKASIDVTPFVAVLFAIFAAVLVTRPSLAALNVDSPPHGPTYDATFAPDGSLYVRRHVGDGEYRYLPEEDVFWRVYPLGGDRIQLRSPDGIFQESRYTEIGDILPRYAPILFCGTESTTYVDIRRVAAAAADGWHSVSYVAPSKPTGHCPALI